MCGIAGFSGTFRKEALAAASVMQQHRGPDGDGLWIAADGRTGLAHRRLSILDLSPAGAQPMFSADGRVALVFNGEIYNFQALRAELEQAGHAFRGHSDTEVLLALYLAHGTAMLARLNGIFAFAIWDARSEELFIARDALGVKPLYYAALDSGVAFASEIKALLCLAPQARALDHAALHRYLSYLWCPGEGTPLRDVRKLLPGQALLVCAGRVARHWSWYSLPVFRAAPLPMDAADAVDQVTAGLRAAVRRQMVADVPVGAFLSGGLDSSTVVALAREVAPAIRCFTIAGAGDAGEVDDLPYARRVAEHLGVPLDVVSIDAGRMADDLESMIVQLDEPLADPAPLNVRYIAQLARRDGIKVLLSGTGGDDLFTGYRRHTAIQYERYWRWLPTAARRLAERAGAGLDQRNPLLRRASKLFNGISLDGDTRIASYFMWAREAELHALYTPAFRAALRDEGAAVMTDFLAPLGSGVAPLAKMLALEQRFFLADHNLIYTDKMSMAAGVEVRVPFLDLELVELANRIPLALRQRGTVGKWVLKQAMLPFLPADVVHRPKAGFGAPLRRWMREDLRALVGDLLAPHSLARRGLFDPAAVQRLIADNASGKVDAAYTLLSLLSIEIWCRHFIDAAPPILLSGHL